MANELSNLKPVAGAQKARTRIGRGQGSGLGKTAGKGTKGQQARTGYTLNVGFEGGQMPLKRRIPKRGFTNIFAKDYTELAVGKLAGFDAGTVVDAELLLSKGIVSRVGRDGVKLIGSATALKNALSVKVAKATAGAKAAIEAAGGSVETSA
jgi:large subunit ribosomal protein L15